MNAGLDAFLHAPQVLALAGAARVTVVQAMGAQALSNRYYRVHPRRNDRFLGPSPALSALFREVDFTEGVILVNEGRFDDAVELFEGLVAADPDWAAARIRAGATRLARAEGADDAIAVIDDRRAAEAMLVAAVATEPDNEDGLALLVAAREAMGRPEDAVEPLRALVERVPGDRRHRYRLARALVAAGEPVEAIEVLDASITALGPEGVPATVLRVEALIAAGRRNDASVVVADFRDRLPRHPAGAMMQGLLSEGEAP
jgi:predicted Zn-dependent protease